MKTNLGIELTDDERDALANLIDGKDTTRLATRKEVAAIAQNHIGGLARQAEAESFEDVYEEDQPDTESERAGLGTGIRAREELYVVDQSDPLTKTMATPGNPSYVRGWNQVKNRSGK